MYVSTYIHITILYLYRDRYHHTMTSIDEVYHIEHQRGPVLKWTSFESDLFYNIMIYRFLYCCVAASVDA